MSTEPETFEFTVSGFQVNVVRKNIQNIHLAVYPPTGDVRLASPLNVRKESLRLFVISKLSWIKNHIRNMTAQVREAEREYIQGESHYLFGKRYLLNISENNRPPSVSVPNNRVINLSVRPGSDKAKKEEVMREWYRDQFKSVLPEIIQSWEDELGVKVSDWSIRKMKTKWGSCNIEEKRITLNLELAKKPQRCINYVVLHEMLHFHERHHNKRYRSLLDSYMPGWRSLKEELNEVVY